MQNIVDELEVQLADDTAYNSDHIVHSHDIFEAIQCLHPPKVMAA